MNIQMRLINFAPIEDRNLFNYGLGFDRFNVTTDGNITLSWWKQINALSIRSFKITHSDTRVKLTRECNTILGEMQRRISKIHRINV